MPEFFYFLTRIESEQFSQYGLQDSTVTVVVHFNRRVDHLRLELDNGTICSGRLNRCESGSSESSSPSTSKDSSPVNPSDPTVWPSANSNGRTPIIPDYYDAFVHSWQRLPPYPHQLGSFGGPVSTTSGTVPARPKSPRESHPACTSLPHHISTSLHQLAGNASRRLQFLVLIADSNISKRTTQHNSVITTS